MRPPSRSADNSECEQDGQNGQKARNTGENDKADPYLSVCILIHFPCQLTESDDPGNRIYQPDYSAEDSEWFKKTTDSCHVKYEDNGKEPEIYSRTCQIGNELL